MTEARTGVRPLDASSRLRSGLPVWVLAAHPDRCPAWLRAAFEAEARAAVGGPSAAGTAMLVTCHRVEVYGAVLGDGGAPDPVLERLVDAHPEFRGRLRLLEGDAAARHVLRLAAGLESAVVGEDQILHQVRELRETVRREAGPALSRLLETAIRTGRRARAARPASRTVQTLATRAVDWLCLDGDLRQGDALLVAGAGRMGSLLAREGVRRGFRVAVASRSLDRASAVAHAVGAVASTLDDAAPRAAEFDAIAVALSGPWRVDGERPLPPLIDLSAPPATPPRRPGDGPRLDIDGLYAWDRLPAGGEVADYVEHATALTEEALEAYRRWWAGRASVGAIRSLRAAAKRERDEHLGRLMRRLPDLTAGQRALIEEHVDQLVAALLHAPTARLRDDVDGTAAAAAQWLFGPPEER